MDKSSFRRFDDVQHLPLRVFNRVAVMINLYTDFSKEVSADYASIFDEEERKHMYLMQQYIKQHGLEQTRKVVTKGLTIIKDVDEYE